MHRCGDPVGQFAVGGDVLGLTGLPCRFHVRRQHLRTDGQASDQRRPDDVLLLHRRSRSHERVHHRWSHRSRQGVGARRRRDRGLDRAGRHLPVVQRVGRERAGVGSGDLHRHRVPHRCAGDHQAQIPCPVADILADPGRGRRHRRAVRDRALLLRSHPGRATCRGGGVDHRDRIDPVPTRGQGPGIRRCSGSRCGSHCPWPACIPRWPGSHSRC